MKTTKDTTLTLKVPTSLIKRLDKAAQQGARNRSAEVRARLERSLVEMPIFTGQTRSPGS